MDSEKKNNILSQRAEKLALVQERNLEEIYMEVVEVCIGTNKFALPSKYVSEVITIDEIIPVPCTPEFVVGIVNVRGRIVSIVDILSFLGLPVQDENPEAIIILTYEKLEVGILVDRIEGLVNIAEKNIQPVENLTNKDEVTEKFLLGLTKEASVLLNLEAILADNSFIVMEDIESN